MMLKLVMSTLQPEIFRSINLDKDPNICAAWNVISIPVLSTCNFRIFLNPRIFSIIFTVNPIASERIICDADSLQFDPMHANKE